MEGVEHRGRELPWPSIIRFHKEIAARAEESFFSLPADDQSGRWTSLNGFDPAELAGPWQVQRSALRSRNFLLSLDQQSHQALFIGGACYAGSERVDGGYQPRWRPVVFREVEVKVIDDEIQLIPRQAHWQLSPLIFSLIDRLQVRPDGIEHLADDVIEKAAALAHVSGLDLAESMNRALAALVPEVEQEISRPPSREDFRVAPTRWVLFAPESKHSALTRYLIRDYQRIEQLLDEAPPNLGGLKLLEDRSPAGFSEGEALPVVPLNNSQRAAVRSALGDRPLTVISGPPGCGKSQVVVSMLLNCWATGTTVLFASNNNKAVDVVKERLERYQSQFPVAVRAGSKKFNNVADVLRRTLNMASAARSKKGPGSEHDARKRRGTLMQQRAELTHQLNSRLPQKVDEALRFALTAYSASLGKLEELRALSAQLLVQLTALRVDRPSGDEVLRALKSTREWVTRIIEVKAQIDADEARRRMIGAELPALAERLAGALSRTGWSGDGGAVKRWLLNGPSPEALTQWDVRARAVFERSLDADLESLPWKRDFDEWVGEDAAKSWSESSSSLASNIRKTCGELAPVIERIQSLRQERDLALTAATKLGIPEDLEVKRAVLDLWAAQWSEVCSLRPGRLDVLPWTRRSTLERQLNLSERDLRQGLPIAIWSRIGRLDNAGRTQLADVVEGCRAWQDARDRWLKAREEREATEGRFELLRAAAAQLHVSPIPTTVDIESWKGVATKLEARSRAASLAADAWSRRSARERTQSAIRRLVTDWISAANGSPLKDAWCETLGADFNRRLRALLDQQTPEALQDARRVYYATSLSGLVEPWQEAMVAQRGIDSLQSELAKIPSQAAHIRAWATGRPDVSLLEAWSASSWPDESVLLRWSERLQEVDCWCEAWERFEGKQRPELQASSYREWTLAKDSLLKATTLLPDVSEFQQLRELATQTAEKRDGWATDELTEGFRELSPDMLKARIDGIDAALERSAFDDATSEWLARLAEDTTAVRALDALEKAMTRNRGDLPAGQVDAFKAALRLVPVWITTAQAPQAIPLEPELFDLVIIDEASQCTLTNLLPLMYRAKRLVVIGDEQQLPAIPTIQESEELMFARKHRIEEHLDLIGHVHNNVFKVAAASLPRQRGDVMLLAEHFRSHPLIIGFSNRHVYNKRLEIKRDPTAGRVVPFGSGLHQVHVRGQAARRGRGGSWMNVDEAKMVLDKVQFVKESAPYLSVGVVTPFAAQRDWLREQVDRLGLASEVLVDTAYGFQGDERDVMFFSPVVARGITPGACNWVEQPPNLINVALTRAREALFVVADFDFCRQQHGLLRDLADYCRDVQTLRDTSPAELALYSWMIVEGLTPVVHPRIGDHEVDFTLRGAGGVQVAVEIDGAEFHDGKTQRDGGINAYLEGRGFRVVRVSGRAAIETPHDVIHQIQKALN